MEEKKTTRVCKHCGRELPLEDFAKNKNGYTFVCKECRYGSKKAPLPQLEPTPVPDFTPEEKKIVDRAGEIAQATLGICNVPDSVLLDELKRRGFTGHLARCYEL